MKTELHRGNPLAVLTSAHRRKARARAIAIATSGAAGHKSADWTNFARPFARVI